MFRFLWINAFVFIYSVFFSLWGVFLGLFDKTGKKVHFYTAVPWAKSVLWVCGIKVPVKGLENVDKHTPHIYMCNHQSYFDIFAVLARIPVDFKFIVKAELMRIPLLGPAMRRAGYIGIERDDPRKAIRSIKDAAERIKSGASVLIFPEGTRSPDGRLQPFKKGGFNLALRSGCDIVPVTIRDSYRIVPKGSLHVNKGSFSMVIGKPIPVTGFRKKTMQQLMDRVWEAMFNQLTSGEPVVSAGEKPLSSEIADPAPADRSGQAESRREP
ncbi:MAG: 1-acyl-sn-glycerol-3-phosphate acyltransferase [Deltaproteobacteria bacterium]|nr:1-acyl-sn-glycerol-3-phosphate acyltransferase [Deltaproteobacteria bacterium]